MNKYINFNNLNKPLNSFNSKKPFPYAIMDNFFKKSIAIKLSKEFPKYANTMPVNKTPRKMSGYL